MDDTLLEGDVFIVLNFWYGFRLPFMKQPIVKGFDPLPDDILIFKAPVAEDEVHVKRCIAVGGQTVEIVEKKLFIDDVEIPLPPKGKHADPVIIPAGPYGSGTVIHKHVECSPCYKRECPIDFRCMTRITPDEVYTAIVSKLE